MPHGIMLNNFKPNTKAVIRSLTQKFPNTLTGEITRAMISLVKLETRKLVGLAIPFLLSRLWNLD